MSRKRKYLEESLKKKKEDPYDYGLDHLVRYYEKNNLPLKGITYYGEELTEQEVKTMIRNNLRIKYTGDSI